MAWYPNNCDASLLDVELLVNVIQDPRAEREVARLDMIPMLGNGFTIGKDSSSLPVWILKTE